MRNIYFPKYCDANSILLVNQVGILRILYCPFRVKCNQQIGALQPGMTVWVEKVGMDDAGILIYFIMGRPYYYWAFEINIGF